MIWDKKLNVKKINGKVNSLIDWIDRARLEYLLILVLLIILAPILYLGKGAVFPVSDQLDETILNYVFSARFIGKDVYDAMMCGAVSTESLKPFAPFFLPFYVWLSEYTAFLIQFIIVITTALIGTYFCVKKITGSSISAFLSASVFSLLPFRSVYGNMLSGIPLLFFCLLIISEDKKREHGINLARLFAYLGCIYYAASSSLVLIGYAVLIVIGVWMVIRWIKNRHFDLSFFTVCLLMGFTYLFLNLDIVKQVLFSDGVRSHREEFVIGGNDFLYALKNYLFSGVALNESFHKYIFIAIIVALPFAVWGLIKRESVSKAYFIVSIIILILAVIAASLGSQTVAAWKGSKTGMLRSFQAQRFYLILPGLWYVLLGISIALILKGIKNVKIASLGLAVLVYVPTLFFVAKNPDCIFYMNVNQINNKDITGYITWEALYSEDLMSKIDSDIGKDKSTYRVASIGICPVVPLMHGFYTIDGYSNNYSLDYKHEFRKVIEKELELNDYNAQYFDDWGNRCYMFYHEWGNAFFINKHENLVINDFEFNLEKMREMNCRYIFSAGEIKSAEEKGMTLVGEYETDTSYWRIFVYELRDNE